MATFDFTELLAEAEERLDDQGMPPHFGLEESPAEGETYTGRYRGEDVDENFDPPRVVYLLSDLDGTQRFIRSRTMLERSMRQAAPAIGDYLAIVRGQDSETKNGNTLQMWAVSSSPCTDPLPEVDGEVAAPPAPEDDEGDGEAEAEADDIPF